MHRRQTRYLRPISIHALREESDMETAIVCTKATGISIHALREESDDVLLTLFFPCTDFNPRPPRGERPGSLENFS